MLQSEARKPDPAKQPSCSGAVRMQTEYIALLCPDGQVIAARAILDHRQADCVARGGQLWWLIRQR